MTVDALPCRQEPDLFFAEAPADLEIAKMLCADCPVRVECLASALDRAEPWGVWGGEVFIGGTIAPTKRGRGRPRKNPPPLDVPEPHRQIA